MAYIRKTTDEYTIHSDYGYGFEENCTAEDWSDAKRLLKDYRTNEPRYTHKIVKKRIPKCYMCGTTDNVSYVADPYDADVNNTIELHNMCETCYDIRADDI